ncbi:MAG: glyoxylate/hydroxypyruvate reductase A [Pseudomonadota bacterium]
MTALLTTANWSSTAWMRELREADANRRFVLHGVDTYEPAEVRYALTWKPPKGLLPSLPNLEVVFNLGAGVDAVLADPELPDVPVVRLVDDDLTDQMTEWVTLQVLAHHRQALTYAAQQRANQWRDREQPATRDVRVGFLGYGVLAQSAAKIIEMLGFQVQGWSRSPKEAPIKMFAGEAGLRPFLAETDILVVLLPLTPATREIINTSLIDALAKDGAHGGPILINAGRGGLQNEVDILTALQDGRLKGASLDVFQVEPLPASSPLWSAPNLIITPHCSAVSNPRAVSQYVTKQISAYERGEALQNVVDRTRGY